MTKRFISLTPVFTVSSQRNLEGDSLSTPPRTSHLVSYPKLLQARDGHLFTPPTRYSFLYKPVILAKFSLGSSPLLCSWFFVLYSWLQVGLLLVSLPSSLSSFFHLFLSSHHSLMPGSVWTLPGGSCCTLPHINNRNLSSTIL